MSKTGPRLSRLGVLAPAALSACIDASVLAAPAAGAIVSTVLKELSKAFMLKKWFHGVMSAKEAEQLLLQRGKSGSYLVRESRANPGEYVLSVRVRGRVRHVMIRREQNKYDVGSGEIFDDLSGLIEHCRAFPLTETSGEVLRLRQPVGGARSRQRSADKDNQPILEPELKVEIKKTAMNSHFTAIFEKLQVSEGRYENSPTSHTNLVFNNLINEEFAGVKAADTKIWFTKNEGKKHENLYKNRYREIIPYDQTRVKLPRNIYSLDGTYSDYINASYIRPLYMFEPILMDIAAATLPDSDKECMPLFDTKEDAAAAQWFSRLLTIGTSKDAEKNASVDIGTNGRVPDEAELRRLRQDNCENVADKFYIAAQGNLVYTRHNFWAAIADNDVRVIAMLTREIEHGNRKCDSYWPKKYKRECYGDLEITTLEESQEKNQNYVHRQIQIYNKLTEKRSIVTQFQYLDWPDHYTPKDTRSILQYIQAVNDEMLTLSRSEMNAPKQNILWVHCSAGIGRTGTFIALDMLIDQVKYEMKYKEGHVPVVPSTVKLLRWQRPGMVQNRRQYAFIYAALSEYVDIALSVHASPATCEFFDIEPLSPNLI